MRMQNYEFDMEVCNDEEEGIRKGLQQPSGSWMKMLRKR